MTTQTVELQAVTDEELLGAAGGHFPHYTAKIRDTELQHLAEQKTDHADHGLQSLLASTTVSTMG